MDYWKVNKETRKDNFPLPFIDQMFDRLAVMNFIIFWMDTWDTTKFPLL